MVHVAYKGSAAYINDLIGGQVPAAIDAVADLTELHRAGRIRILATYGRDALAGDARRADVHRARAQERRRVAAGSASSRRPTRRRPMIDTLNRGINKALASPDVVERLTKLGMDPATSTPEEFARIVASDYAKWGPIVKASGFTAD